MVNQLYEATLESWEWIQENDSGEEYFHFKLCTDCYLKNILYLNPPCALTFLHCNPPSPFCSKFRNLPPHTPPINTILRVISKRKIQVKNISTSSSVLIDIWKTYYIWILRVPWPSYTKTPLVLCALNSGIFLHYSSPSTHPAPCLMTGVSFDRSFSSTLPCLWTGPNNTSPANFSQLWWPDRVNQVLPPYQAATFDLLLHSPVSLPSNYLAHPSVFP